MTLTTSHIVTALIAGLAFARAAPTADHQVSYPIKYYCASTAQTLACCTGTTDIGNAERSGCSPYNNESASGKCSENNVFCCTNVTGGEGILCGSATVMKTSEGFESERA